MPPPEGMRGNTVEGRWVPEWPCGAALLTWAFSCLAYHVRLLSHVRLFVTPWTIARQAPLSTGFSSQEHWSGLPFPPPGDLPSPGKEPTSLMSPALAGGLFTTGFTWEALQIKRMSLIYLPCLPDEKRVLREKQLGEGRGERKARSSSSDER